MKTTTEFIKMKQDAKKITMITAYDYPSAKLVEQAGTDLILVGDSLGMVVLGYESTVPVTMDDMIHHGKAVKRGAKDTFIVIDMPFMSYHLSNRDTLINATRLIQETGANAVKIEGADDVIDQINSLTNAGIPVMAHLGLTPQSVGVLGGYKVQGKSSEEAKLLVQNALKCQEAGAFAVVLECVPMQVAKEVSDRLDIPTIGIGAGSGTDGQVLVYHDLITYGVDRVAKFVKQYTNVNDAISLALDQYISEVKLGTFPEIKHSFQMKADEVKSLYGGKRQ
ncbi:3-methyl-2-oxobutanoate hydroxymethyltransferase [Niallia sp. JL1B1071]|uniref:3-methyl-2-oxobutanoate hydroxymethyltransferase n=1 Tax=Niallia tiangongensis TaxID=3237105 RepID=UPI0037DC8674